LDFFDVAWTEARYDMGSGPWWWAPGFDFCAQLPYTIVRMPGATGSLCDLMVIHFAKLT